MKKSILFLSLLLVAANSIAYTVRVHNKTKKLLTVKWDQLCPTLVFGMPENDYGNSLAVPAGKTRSKNTDAITSKGAIIKGTPNCCIKVVPSMSTGIDINGTLYMPSRTGGGSRCKGVTLYVYEDAQGKLIISKKPAKKSAIERLQSQ